LVDVITIIYVLINALLGFRYGLFRRFIHIGAFYLGLLLAQALSPGVSQMLNYHQGPYPVAAHFGVYLGVVFFMVVALELIMFGFKDALGAMNALIFDRFFGLAVGILAGIFEMAVIIYLFQYMATTPVQSGGSKPAIVNYFSGQLDSPTPRALIQLRPYVIVLYRPVLPPEPTNYFAKTIT
jgi:uncharacterized membrane protein required for colicin V production